jgi:hypothetical protein
MAIPKFSATDHFEYKKWAFALEERLTTTAQRLYELLDDEKTKPDALRAGLAKAEKEYATLTEAAGVLPENLAAALAKSSERVAGKLKDRIARAQSRLKE